LNSLKAGLKLLRLKTIRSAPLSDYFATFKGKPSDPLEDRKAQEASKYIVVIACRILPICFSHLLTMAFTA
jgi:hypothetical protein